MAMKAAPTQAEVRDGVWRAPVWAGRIVPRFGAFWRCWGRALLTWLPEAVRDRFGLWPQRLLLREQGGALACTLLRGHAHELGTLALDEVLMLSGGGRRDPLDARFPAAIADLPRWLVLPAAAVLRRRLHLPVAAAERLRDVTAFEIDRQTPFSSADVVHDARLLRARADGQIEAELMVCPRATLDAALARLGGLAEGLAGVDVAAQDGTPLGINLLPAARRYQRNSQAVRRQWVLLVVSAALLALALWQVLDNRRAAVLDWQRTADVRSAAAREVARAEREALELAEGVRLLSAERARRPGMVEVMAALAQRLPDTTHLDRLAIEGTRITLIGLSADAPALVGRLQDSPLWHSPALAGVVLSDPATRLERFTLTAELTLSGDAHAP